MRRLLIILLLLLPAGPVWGGTIWITGFETASGSNTQNIGSADIMIYGLGSSSTSTTKRSGGYALQQGANFSRVWLNNLGPSISTISCRIWMRTSVNVPIGQQIFFSDAATSATLFAVTWDLTNMVLTNAGAGFTTTPGTAVVAPNTWTRIDVAYDTAAGGIGKVWVNGVLDISTTHTGAQNPVARFSLNGESVHGYQYDDIHCNDTLTPPPEGCVIARQPISGSPVDTGFTLSGCATIEECWGETPWSAAKNANSGSTTSEVAQTAIVSPVTSTQTGFGTTVIPTGAQINAVTVQAIAKTSNPASGGLNGHIRYRVNGGAAVDLAVTNISTVDHGFPEAALGSGTGNFWTDTVANLDLYEIGWVKDATAIARTHTVEDMWLMVDFLGGTDCPATTIGIKRKVKQD